MPDTRDRDTSIERCEINIQDRPDKAECRLIVKMICNHGLCLYTLARYLSEIDMSQG